MCWGTAMLQCAHAMATTADKSHARVYASGPHTMADALQQGGAALVLGGRRQSRMDQHHIAY